MREAEAKRRHVRFRCEGVAEITTEGAPSLAGTILDLSREGCLFLLKHPLILAQSTKVNVTFKLNGQQFQMAGVVRSQRESTRIGIRFDGTNAKLGGQLGTLKASQTAGSAGRRPPDQQPLSPGSNTVAAAIDKEPTAIEATAAQTDS